MRDAHRAIVTIHGVQWQRDEVLAGYSRPLHQRVQAQAPSTRFRFHEVLWSNVVEPIEQLIANGASLAAIVGGSQLVPAGAVRALRTILEMAEHRARRKLDRELTRKPLAKLIARDKTGFLYKAFSAVLDVIFYESGLYRAAIQKRLTDVLDTLDGQAKPVVYAHSLGCQVAFDVLTAAARPRAFALVTCAPTLGLLERKLTTKITTRLTELDWTNFYDTDDFLAPWNPLRHFGYRQFLRSESSVDASEIPFYSHVKYWGNSAISRELADLATTEDP